VFTLMPGTAVELGLLVLAFGDPAASVLGKRYGKRKLWREKSLVGFNAFIAISFVVSFIFLSLAMGGETLTWRLGVAAIAAVVGAVTELFSERLDDNFTILVMTAGVLTVTVL
jgi:phytol kinase